MKPYTREIILFILVPFLCFSCDKIIPAPEYFTKNVIIIVIDGARYSETWGDSSFDHIPEMHKHLSTLGCIYTNFYNNGPTYTLAGHAAITTGFYQEIDNSGKEYPQNPSIFQTWNNKYKNESNRSWIISSKDKLQVLASCKQNWWKGNCQPSTNCGINGLGVGSGSRNDSATFRESLNILSENHPNLVLLSYREPDYSGHQGNWKNYLKGISDTDNYLEQLWNFLQNDSIYKGCTTLFVTNDHGRHLDGVLDGFVSHGDACEGCKHVFLFACGPDFKQAKIIDKKRELIDIPATISILLNFKLPAGNGKPMDELFE